MKIKNSILTMLLAFAVLLPGIANAIAPANTRLNNTAELTYLGLPPGVSIQASVTVVVALTPSAPVLSTPPDQTTAENQQVNYLYTITATANGADTYEFLNIGNPSTLTPNADMQSTSPAPTFFQGVNPISSVILGATAADNNFTTSDNVITVPSDGVADTSINGIQAGDTVVINGTAYTVAVGGISDDGTNASITLTSNLVAAMSTGDLIAERQTFTARIPDVGTVVAAPVGTPSVDMDVVAVSSADNSLFATDETITTIVEVTFEKYVRNVSNDNGSGAVNVGGTNYYSTAGNVQASSGDVLEYALRVTAPAGSSLTGVVFTDTIPQFTAYDGGTTALNGVGVGDNPGPVSPVVTGMSVNSAGEAVGTVAAGASAVVTFRVIVD